ncbi:MAG: hypothetical protein V1774_04240 [Candidatus Eisenbacteria bacterium]
MTSGKRTPLCLLILLALALAGPARASLKVGPPSIGTGILRFHDADLRSLYDRLPQLVFILRGHGLSQISPTLAVACSWASHRDPDGFLAASETQVLFLPVMLQIPWEQHLNGTWMIRVGPQFTWAGLREEWNATVSEAQIDATGHSTASWLAAGVMGELWARLGGAGSVGLAADWNWTSADRATARGNRERETPMEGGWSGLRLCWTPFGRP